jgi:hypothetical protein
MRNFVLHFDEIKNPEAKEKISRIFSEYAGYLHACNYDFERETSYTLARNYLFSISKYYMKYSDFMAHLRVSVILLFGFTGDSLLYLTGIPDHILYIPNVTICIFIYQLSVRVIKEPKGRVFGIFY